MSAASDDAIAPKSVNFSGRVAELSKNRFGVLPQGRNRIEARGAIGKPQRAPDDGDGAYRRFHLADHFSRDHLRMSEDFADAV